MWDVETATTGVCVLRQVHFSDEHVVLERVGIRHVVTHIHVDVYYYVQVHTQEQLSLSLASLFSVRHFFRFPASCCMRNIVYPPLVIIIIITLSPPALTLTHSLHCYNGRRGNTLSLSGGPPLRRRRRRRSWRLKIDILLTLRPVIVRKYTQPCVRATVCSRGSCALSIFWHLIILFLKPPRASRVHGGRGNLQ